MNAQSHPEKDDAVGDALVTNDIFVSVLHPLKYDSMSWKGILLRLKAGLFFTRSQRVLVPHVGHYESPSTPPSPQKKNPIPVRFPHDPAHCRGTPDPCMMENEPDFNPLLDRIEAGATDLFLQVVRLHELPLRTYLATQVYVQADVEDLAQEVFIAAYRDLHRFQRDGDFGAWLRGIARNRLLTYFRSQKRRSTSTERFRREVARLAEEDLELAMNRADEDRIDRILHCISKLPDKLKRVVRSGLEGARPASLAEEFRTSIPAIYQLHYRANQLLRDCMNQPLDDAS